MVMFVYLLSGCYCYENKCVAEKVVKGIGAVI